MWIPDIGQPPPGDAAATGATMRWRRPGALLRRIAGQTLDIVYPPSCIACLGATQNAQALCVRCWSAMPFVERPFCERLGTPFGHDLGPGLISPEAMADPPVYGRARVVARYKEGPARQLVHRLKYGDRTELAQAMGVWMARAGAEVLAGADVLVPVPLHRRRLFWRRFNQAAALARAISSVAGVPVDPLALRRVKPTPPQIGLSRAQRADNVQGAFRVRPADKARIADRRVVLIDDVMTSGATANAAARVLLRAGAANVDALVFARVVRGL